MDPYVVINMREQLFRTKEATDQGKNPYWNEKFELDVKYVGDYINLEVFD